MRPCRASCEARSSMVVTGSCCSSATGLCPRRRHKPGSRSRNRLVVSWSQLHHRLLARRRRRSCVGATNCPWVRARLTTCESWCPAALIAATIAGSNARAVTVCTTSTPCSRPRSMSGTPRNERYGSSPASLKLAAGAGRLERAARRVQPHVDALHQVPADVDVVVLDEQQLAGERGSRISRAICWQEAPCPACRADAPCRRR